MKLPHWKGPLFPKVSALNIVDEGSRKQVVIPFYEQETGELLRRLYRIHWKRHYGSAEKVVLDVAKTNLSTAMEDQFAWDGTRMSPIAGEAAWQNGLAERHGKLYEDKLLLAMDTLQPSRNFRTPSLSRCGCTRRTTT